MMWRKFALTFLAVVSFQPVAVAVHEQEGVVHDYFPWTIGSPDFNSDVYSGISLTIKPGAPTDLRFKTGQAAWLGFAETTIVDTELELSVFTLDAGAGLPLVQNEPPPGPLNAGGLLIGDVLPSKYYGSVLTNIDVSYRLTGSTEIRQGTISNAVFVPEPNAFSLGALGVISLLGFRKKRSSPQFAAFLIP